jgi:hypothetical protein
MRKFIRSAGSLLNSVLNILGRALRTYGESEELFLHR